MVESRFGRIRVTDSRMTANSGNGIKAKLLDRKYLIIDEDKSFCKRINLGGNQMFPQVISGIPNKYTTSCDKVRTATLACVNNVLAAQLHLLYFCSAGVTTTRAALPQNRVESLIGSQANYEIQTNIKIYFVYTILLKVFNIKLLVVTDH